MINLTVNKDISLKMFEQSDAKSLYSLVDENRLYLREWLPWIDSNQSWKDSLSYIESGQKQYSDQLGFNTGIYYFGKLVGICGYHPIDQLNKKVVIGYWLAESAQGKGIVTQCTKYLIDYAFNTLLLNKVSISAAEYNYKSQAVCERLGLVKEGHEREGEFLYDHYVNLIHYSILRAEWNENMNNNTKARSTP